MEKGKTYDLPKNEEIISELLDIMFEEPKNVNNKPVNPVLAEITKVIFHEPATIVYWKDGTRTVVQARGETFDKEKGLAMAIVKKACGNTRDYYDIFFKYTPEDTRSHLKPCRRNRKNARRDK